MSSHNDFETAIANLDLSLFEQIESQSTDSDRASLLACQLAVRELRPKYNYLEIGSYIGGSIQPYLLDDRCERIFSIDKRPHSQPDERGIDYVYEHNSTERMLDNLAKVAPIDKITTIDGSSSDIEPSKIDSPVDLAFIDGEHTDRAVVADFEFCLKTLESSGAIVFHDAQITYNGIAGCLELLKTRNIDFKAYALPNIVFVVEIGDLPLHRHPAIYERLVNNHESYLFSLQNNDHYRRFANRRPFRVARNLLVKLQGSNISR